jgi:O-antigen/teichoic acid export membrane protein
VYGSKFSDSLQPFLLLLPGVTGFSLVTVLAAHIAGCGRPSINLVAAGVALVVTLSLDLMLIPRIGVPGAAIASSASYLTSAVVTAGIFSWMTHISPLRLVVPTRADVELALRLARRILALASRS